ncbi:hypothetical protein NPIL_338841 [Nephila pilipes]|uniref:Uncharacterized protein n=1 Tax=Nephila pilipes TaxID=299642 RepID=A0A8X6MU03_NEPPI|nr:hypothetical protein NPIL_338841 [Nephila pilipes]
MPISSADLVSKLRYVSDETGHGGGGRFVKDRMAWRGSPPPTLHFDQLSGAVRATPIDQWYGTVPSSSFGQWSGEVGTRSSPHFDQLSGVISVQPFDQWSGSVRLFDQ